MIIQHVTIHIKFIKWGKGILPCHTNIVHFPEVNAVPQIFRKGVLSENLKRPKITQKYIVWFFSERYITFL
jgi:hypothetical protein